VASVPLCVSELSVSESTCMPKLMSSSTSSPSSNMTISSIQKTAAARAILPASWALSSNVCALMWCQRDVAISNVTNVLLKK